MKTVQELFPNHRVFERGAGRFEAVGLPEGTAPANCEVLLHGEAKFSNGKRNTHYLVTAGGEPVYVRVCTALPESGGAEFAALEVPLESELPSEFMTRITDRIAALTRHEASQRSNSATTSST